MPEMDGLESTRLIRQFYEGQGIDRKMQPMIIGLTGHAEAQYKVLGMEAGMDEVLSKPIYFEDILKIFQSVGLI
jgi:CheY-like chemotaxis protein